MSAPSGSKLHGLYAAAYTPFAGDGSVNVAAIPRLVEHLLTSGANGLYVCGSTGEGVSLTSEERRDVAAHFVTAAAGRVPVVVQVGHNSLREAAELARHAAAVGATAISATCPSYFPISTIDCLVDSMTQVAAAAPQLPFYYYHIPSLTGSALDMVRFLERAGSQIPNLAGLKYSDPAAYGYQACSGFDNGRYDILWGVDEMLLSALVVGCRGAVGSTYNVAAPLYRRLIDAFTHGDLVRCRELQAQSVEFVRTVARYPFHSAMKQILKWQGVDCGTCRLPISGISESQLTGLQTDLDHIGFWDWSKK